MNDKEIQSPESLRDMGIALWNNGCREQDEELKNQGVSYLLKAYNAGDIDAAACVGFFLYCGNLHSKDGDSKEAAIRILYRAANSGSMLARTFLNKKCAEQYDKLIEERGITEHEPGPLMDFDGNRITINKTGRTVPIDAVLEYVDDTNVLTFSLNLFFIDDDVSDQPAFEKAVISGIKEWEGEYRVFGDQKLQIKINVTMDDRMFDNVNVLAMTDKYFDMVQKYSGLVKTKTGRHNMDVMINQKRSGAVTGLLKWSVKSRKTIYIISKDGTFRDLDEIKHVAKHEFGHALGLGDLYESPGDWLEGVEKGTYAELDGFYVSDKNYNLVMSDHHGPISNNDIEMVVLAFSENKMQLYQKHPKIKGVISKALGKGN